MMFEGGVCTAGCDKLCLAGGRVCTWRMKEAPQGQRDDRDHQATQAFKFLNSGIIRRGQEEVMHSQRVCSQGSRSKKSLKGKKRWKSSMQRTSEVTEGVTVRAIFSYIYMCV